MPDLKVGFRHVSRFTQNSAGHHLDKRFCKEWRNANHNNKNDQYRGRQPHAGAGVVRFCRVVIPLRAHECVPDQAE